MNKSQMLIENYLTELVRNAHQIISPQSQVDELQYLFDKNNRESFRQRYPECMEAIRFLDGRKEHIFPLCNSSGNYEPKVIKITIMLIKKFKEEEDERFDKNHLEKLLSKIERVHNKYTKDDIKSYNMAYHKGNVTKGMNKVRDYLQKIKGEIFQ